MCRLIKKPVEYNDPAPSPNFECPVYGAEEEDYDEIPEEVSRLLERKENSIQPYKEPLEVINLGLEEDPKEFKIGVLLHPETAMTEPVIWCNETSLKSPPKVFYPTERER